MNGKHDQYFKDLLANAANPRRASGRTPSSSRTKKQTAKRPKPSRTPQFNVTITDRGRLDALSAKLGLPRSAVINLALAELAEKHGL